LVRRLGAWVPNKRRGKRGKKEKKLSYSSGDNCKDTPEEKEGEGS